MGKLLIILLLAGGCAFTDSGGTKHTVIVGFGVVSVHQTNSVLVYKVQALGVTAGNLPAPNCTLGYRSDVGITAATNTLVEVSQKPFSPLVITQP